MFERSHLYHALSIQYCFFRVMVYVNKKIIFKWMLSFVAITSNCFFVVITCALKAAFTIHMRDIKERWTHSHYIMEKKEYYLSYSSLEFQHNMLLKLRTDEREIIPDSYLLAVHRFKAFHILHNPMTSDQVTRTEGWSPPLCHLLALPLPTQISV